MIALLGYAFIWCLGTYVGAWMLTVGTALFLRKSDGAAAMNFMARAMTAFLVASGTLGVFVVGIYGSRA